MNITNNPYYTSITSSANPYLDVVTFKPATTKFTRGFQNCFLFDTLGWVTNAVPFILTDFKKDSNGNNQPCEFYTGIMKLVEEYPMTYKCTRKQLQRAYGITYEVINIINDRYKASKTVDEDIYKYGFTIFNNKFLEKAYDFSLNKTLFIGGMLEMANSLEKFKKK